MKRLTIALCIVMLVSTAAFAGISVNYNDLATFKANFADDITQNMNLTGTTDATVYKYIIASINSAWNTYSTYPFFLYSEADGDTSDVTLSAYDDLFDNSTVQFIEVQSKARFFKAIYASMKDLDLSHTSEPEWILIGLQDDEDEVIYLLEVQIGSANSRKLEEHVVDLLGKVVLFGKELYPAIDKCTFTLILATYVPEYDEIVLNMLFTDDDGNLYGEAILTRNNIFGKSNS